MDIIQQLKAQINFIDLATMHGYETIVKKSTKKSMFMERGEDKILVYKHGAGNDSFYYTTCNNTNDKGDIVNFVINKGFAKDIKEAIPYLKKLDPHSLNLTEPTIKNSSKREPFQAVPVHPVDTDNYLIRKRFISLEILRSELFKETVFSGSREYTDEKIKSAIFPLTYQGKVVGQNVRNVDFEHLVENTDKTSGVWSSAQPTSNAAIAVFENPIDAISHHSLFKSQYNYKGTIGSPSSHVVEAICSEALDKNQKLVLCGDNDKSGQHFNMNFLCRYISNAYSLNLLPGFNANANTYSLTLQGSNTPDQEDLFQKLVSQVGPESKITKEKDKLVLTTTYEKERVQVLASTLIHKFDMKESFAVETSKLKDFNLDLQAQVEERNKVLKKKVNIGLSL